MSNDKPVFIARVVARLLFRHSADARAYRPPLQGAAQLLAQAGPAAAFCGFYVAKADSKLFNKSSKVVLTRNGDTTAITMASDYEGEPKEFAVVIPVPTFIERKQIGVVEMKTIDHLDAFTAPRLVEYRDEDPCAPREMVMRRSGGPVPAMAMASPPCGKPPSPGWPCRRSSCRARRCRAARWR